MADDIFVGSPAAAPELLPAPRRTCLENRLLRDSVMIFANDCQWAEPLELWPQGVQANAVPFNGVWDEDAIPGTNEAQGDGRVNETRSKVADRKSIVIECTVDHPTAMESRIAGFAPPSGLTWFQDPQDDSRPDVVAKLLPNGTYLKAKCKRIIGRDTAMISMLAIKQDVKRTMSPGITG